MVEIREIFYTKYTKIGIKDISKEFQVFISIIFLFTQLFKETPLGCICFGIKQYFKFFIFRKTVEIIKKKLLLKIKIIKIDQVNLKR